MKHDARFVPSTTQPIPLQQHPCFARTMAALGQMPEVCDLSTPVVILKRKVPVIGTLRMVSRGPVWPVGVTPGAKIDALAQLRGCDVQIINADAPDVDVFRAAGFQQIMTPAHIATIDLTVPDADRRAAMTAKWRNRLVKAENAAVTVQFRAFDPGKDRWLFAADARQQCLKRFRALPATFVHAFADCNPGATVMAVARHDGAVVAAMVFLIHAPCVTYQIGSTGQQGRDCNAHTLILARAADYFAARGHKQLDLGLVDTETAPGLARFKIGAGATVRPLGGTWIALPWRRKPKLA